VSRARAHRADLGGGLIKQRVARQGQGRSGGYRVIIAHKARNRAIFLLGFAKNEKENISLDELQFLRRLAANWLCASAAKVYEETEIVTLQEIEFKNVEFKEIEDDEEAWQSVRGNSRDGRRPASKRADRQA
jgi:hypothetical protein